jgi:hypothetical protein
MANCSITPIVSKGEFSTKVEVFDENRDSMLFKDINNVLKSQFLIANDSHRREIAREIYDKYYKIKYQIDTYEFYPETLEPNVWEVIEALYIRDLLPEQVFYLDEQNEPQSVLMEAKVKGEVQTRPLNVKGRYTAGRKGILKERKVKNIAFKQQLKESDVKFVLKDMAYLFMQNLEMFNNMHKQEDGETHATIKAMLWKLYTTSIAQERATYGNTPAFNNKYRQLRNAWFTKQSMLYREFKQYMRKLYPVNIEDIELGNNVNVANYVENDVADNVYTEDESFEREVDDVLGDENYEEHNWDNSSQVRINRLNKVRKAVKWEIAKLTAGTSRRAANRICYTPERMDIQEVWNRLLNAHRYDRNAHDVKSTLERLSKESPTFMQIYNSFIAAEEENVDVKETAYNFYASYTYSVLNSIIMARMYNFDIKANTVTEWQANRDSFGQPTIFSKLVTKANALSRTKSVNKKNIKWNKAKDLLYMGVEGSKTPFKHNTNIGLIANVALDSELYTEILNNLSKAALYFDLKISYTTLNTYIRAMLYKDSDILNEETKTRTVSRLLDTINHDLGVLFDYVIESSNKAKDEKSGSINEKSVVTRLSMIANFNMDYPLSYTYLDANGAFNFSPEQDSFLTRKFKGLVDWIGVNKHNVLDSFEPYTHDITLNNSNLLWAAEVDDNGLRKIKTANPMGGIFNYTVDSNGIKHIYTRQGDSIVDSVNEDFIRSFLITKYMGSKNTTYNKGEEYTEQSGNKWILMSIINALQGKYLINNSDSSRMYSIEVPFTSTSIFTNLRRGDTSIKDYNSVVMKSLKNVLKQGLAEWNLGKELLFERDEEGQWIEVDEATQKKQHVTKYFNSKYELLKDGKLQGRAFQFLELSMLDDSSYRYTFLDELREVYKDKHSDLELFDLTDNEIESVFNSYLDKYVAYQLDKARVKTKSIIDYLKDITLTGDTAVIGKSKGYNSSSLLNQLQYKEDIEGGLEYVQEHMEERRNEYINGENGLEQISPKKANSSSFSNTIKAELLDEYELLEKQEIQEINDARAIESIVEAQIYSQLNDIEFGNLFYGKLSEYKDTIEFNKRVAQITKNGGNNTSFTDGNQTRKVLVAKDLYLGTPLITRMYNEGFLSQEVHDMYSDAIETTNGMSIITDIEYEELMKRFGKWDDVKGYVNAFRNGKANPIDYSKLVEQLKMFIYERTPETLTNGQTTMRSKQIKDSTVVIFKNMVSGSEMENLYDYMVEQDIQQLSFESAAKKTGVRGVTVIDTDGRFVRPKDEDAANATISINYASIVNQQDVKPDLLDEDITNATQLSRHILHNLSEKDIYKIGKQNKLFNGKGLRKAFSNTQATEIVESTVELLTSFGAMKNNELNMVNGQIQLDKSILRDYLYNYAYRDQAGASILNALAMDEQGNSTIPFSTPMVYTYFKTVLLAKFSNNIQNRVKGLHVPLRAEMLFRPKSRLNVNKSNVLDENVEGYKEMVEEFRNSGTTTYIDSIHEQVAQGLRDYGLQAERWEEEFVRDENGKWSKQGEKIFKPAEVILNPYMAEFYKDFMKDGVVDINQIPEDLRRMVGFRIPTESKNSAVLFEIVGFMNTGSSQMITPYQLMTRTGWDFDIDTIYAYYKNYDIEVNKDGSRSYNEVEYITNPSLRHTALLDNFIRTRFKQLYSETMFGNNFVETDTAEDTYSSNKLLENYAYMSSYLLGKNGALIAERRLLKNQIKTRSFEEEDKIYTEISEEEDTAKIKVLDRLITLTEEFRNNLSVVQSYRQRNKLIEDTDTTTFEKDKLKEKLVKLTELAKSVMKLMESSTTIKPMFKILGEETIPITHNIKTIIANIEANLNQLRTNEDINDAWENATVDERNTKEARENRMLDIHWASLSNKIHFNELNKNNEYFNMRNASNMVNDAWGYTVKEYNPFDLYDKGALHDLNMSSKKLKGIAVQYINTVLTLGQLQAKLGDTAKYDTVYTPEELGLADIATKDIPAALNNMWKATGLRFKYHRNNNRIVFKNNTVGNNINNNYRDISGQLISFQLGETVSNILDAVKFNIGFNLNSDTLGSFLLITSGASIGKLLNSDGEGNWNRFGYAMALLHQPILIDMTSILNTKRIRYPWFTQSSAIEQTKGKWDIELMNMLRPSIETLIATDAFDKLLEIKLEKEKEDSADSDTKFVDKETGLVTYGEAHLSEEEYKKLKAQEAEEEDNKEKLQTTIIDNGKKYWVDKLKALDKASSEFNNFTLSGGDIVFLGKLIKSIYEDAPMLSNIKQQYPTTQELMAAISDYKTGLYANNIVDYYNYYLVQTNILSTYEGISDGARIVSNAGKILKTEKGLGTTFTEVDSKEQAVADMLLNRQNANDKLHAKKILGKEEIAEMMRDFDNTHNAADRWDWMETNEVTPSKSITVNSENGTPLNIVEAVLPGALTGYIQETESVDKDGNIVTKGKLKTDFSDSMYPSIEAKYANGIWLAQNSLGSIFLQRNTTILSIAKQIIGAQNTAYGYTVTDRVVNHIIQSEVYKNFFSGVPTSELSRIIGSDEEGEAMDNNLPEDFTIVDWKKATLASKLEYLKEERNELLGELEYADKSKNYHFLDLISLPRRTDKRRGYNGINLSKVDSQLKPLLVASFKEMYMSDDFYTADAARDALVYMYLINGFNFGFGISTAIEDLDILSKPHIYNNEYYNEMIEEINAISPNNPFVPIVPNIGQYTKWLQEVENNFTSHDRLQEKTKEAIIGEETLDHIHRQFYTDSKLNPPLPDGKNNAKRNEQGLATFEKELPITIGDIETSVLVEKVSRLERTMYKRSSFVTKQIKSDRNTVTKLYKRFQHGDSNIVFYYEVGKLLPFEYAEVSANHLYNTPYTEETIQKAIISMINTPTLNALTTDLNVPQIVFAETLEGIAEDDSSNIDTFEEEDEYSDEELGINAKDDDAKPLQYSPHKRVVTHSSQLDIVNEAFKNSDTVIYIHDGNNESVIGKQYVKQGAIAVTLNSTPEDVARTIATQYKDKAFKHVHIAGINMSETSKSFTQVADFVQRFTEKLYYIRPNIQSLSSYLNDGVGLSVDMYPFDREQYNYAQQEQEIMFAQIIQPIDKDYNYNRDSKTAINNNTSALAMVAVLNIANASKRKDIPNANFYKSYASSWTKNEVLDHLDTLDITWLDAVLQKLAGDSKAGVPGVSYKTYDTIKQLYENIKDVNIADLLEDVSNRQKFNRDLNMALQLLSTLTIYGDLKPYSIASDWDIQPTDFTVDANGNTIVKQSVIDDFNKQYGEINGYINKLLDVNKRASVIKSQIDRLALEYTISLVMWETRNPKIRGRFEQYLQTVHNHKDVITEDMIFNIQKDLQATIQFVMKEANQDITKLQMYLDSRFDTGIPLVDNMTKQYFHYRATNDILKEKRLHEMDEIFGTTKEDKQKMRQLFRSKFITNHGTLISPYKYADFYAKKRELENKLQSIWGALYQQQGKPTKREVKQANKDRDDAIDDFANNNTKNWTEIPGTYLIDVNGVIKELDNILSNMHPSRQQFFLQKNNIMVVGYGSHMHYYQYELADHYKNADYTKLSSAETDIVEKTRSLIQNTMAETMPHLFMQEDIFPYMSAPKYGELLQRQLGYKHTKKIDYAEQINGRTDYYISMTSLETPDFYFKYTIPEKLKSETKQLFETRVVDQFNTIYNKTKENRRAKSNFVATSIADILLYNNESHEMNQTQRKNTMTELSDANIGNFILQAYENKTIEEFKDDYEIMMYELANARFTKRNHTGDTLVSKAKSKMRGKRTLEDVSGKDSNVYELEDNLIQVLVGERKIGRFDVAAGILNRIGSLTFMFGNIRGGLFKNGLKAITDIIIKANGGYHITKKDLLKGIGHYPAARDLAEAFSETLFRQNKPKTKNVAILKFFDNIFVDSREMINKTTGSEAIIEGINAFNEIGYSPTNIAEHFVQYSMLLGMMESHRVYNGEILSWGNYIRRMRDSIIEDEAILTQDQIKKYHVFLERRMQMLNETVTYNDYLQEFMMMEDSITKDQHNKFNTIYKTQLKEKEEMWKKMDTLYSQTKFDETTGELTFEGVSQQQTTTFGREVQAINQSLHGIYNLVDRIKIQDTAIGELFLQFKKWMRPNLRRIYGRRWNQTSMNENLGTTEVPVYRPFFKFFTMPFTKALLEKKEGTIGERAGIIFKQYANQIRHIRMFYNYMTPMEQSAAREWFAHVCMVAIAAVLVSMVKTDDDDDDKDKTKMELHLQYLAAAVFTEISETTPIYGWWGMAKHNWQRPMVAANISEELWLTVYYGFLQSIGDPDAYRYNRGVYKGQTKAWVHLKKAMPIMRQFNNWNNIEGSTQFYKMINPFM